MIDLKMIKVQIASVLFFFSAFSSFGQNALPELSQVDVLKYTLNIRLNDTTNIIKGEAVIKVSLGGSVETISFNLVNERYSKGMNVKQVRCNEKNINFVHENDILKIATNSSKKGIYEYVVDYEGVPKDGLIIGRNRYGNRTFFCDNWPDRAQNWFPCVDHPLDKAMIEFNITVPRKYSVIGNGELKKEEILSDNTKLYQYQTAYPIPSKVVVFGAAEFLVENTDTVENIPVSAWVYPQNKDRAIKKFDETDDALKFFIKRIGDYPFQKLASVQSSTIFGGMENAGAIFYPEDRVAGSRRMDETIVHEVAHQWFGNSATETDFSHLWLSEGFATYLTNLYFEQKYGPEYHKEMLKKQKQRVIYFYQKSKIPVIDTLTNDYMNMLNPNSYQKGAWVLHMLRKQVGDDLFWEILREYYNKFKYANASTNDFIKVAEQVSGKKLNDFFKQWLYHPGHPIIDFTWEQNDNLLRLHLVQKQENSVFFKFPLELQIIYDDKSSELISLEVEKKEISESISLRKDRKVKELRVDPNVWLLYELN
jgi:aminopeptidase N